MSVQSTGFRRADFLDNGLHSLEENAPLRSGREPLERGANLVIMAAEGHLLTPLAGHNPGVLRCAQNVAQKLA